MSDTRQVVSWALEQGCRLRTGEAVRDIAVARSAVAGAKGYGRALAEPEGRFGIFGDVHVTGVTSATLPPRLAEKGGSSIDHLLHPSKGKGAPCGDYPIHGYLISEKFKDVGGPADLTTMCKQCPANVGRPFPAGCVGYISQKPWCEQTQSDLEAIISKLGLSEAIQETFTATTPIWFGLWTKPVVSPKAAGLFITLLTELIETRGEEPSGLPSRDWREELDLFIKAAHIAESGAAKLRVSLTPPGHTDFGLYTIFPHCPLCQAEADVERWKGKPPVELQTCKVCGMRFSPAEQSSMEHDRFIMPPELRKVLGEARFREFARQYLVARGMSAADVMETIELSEAANAKRRETIARNARENEAIERYIENSLYAGLHIQSMKELREEDRELRQGFTAVEFVTLIQRCAERGIKITGMRHHSVSPELERHVIPLNTEERETFDPSHTLRKWQAEGCDELFAGYFKIPKELIEAFETGNKNGGSP